MAERAGQAEEVAGAGQRDGGDSGKELVEGAMDAGAFEEPVGASLQRDPNKALVAAWVPRQLKGRSASAGCGGGYLEDGRGRAEALEVWLNAEKCPSAEAEGR